MKITEEQKQQLKAVTLDNGTNAWEFVMSRPEMSQPWVAAGILSCIAKGYHLNLMMIGWEARDIRSAAENDGKKSCQIWQLGGGQ